VRTEFSFGESLPADDVVAQWIVKLAMIHNDLVFANNGLMAAADGSVEGFYWQRYAISHYHEAMNCLAEEAEKPEIAALVASLSAEACALHDDAIAVHREIVGPASRVRNEAAFHYPGDQTRKALISALRELAPRTGSVESGEGNKVKTARYHYADDVVATLFYRAMGGTDEDLGRAAARIAEGEKSLMQFINHAQDEFFVRAVGAADASG
jgi:hypothetical protein